MQEPAKACAAAACRLGGERVVRKSREEAADGHSPFEPRQVETGARVDARAEGDVPVRLAGDVETVRIFELCRIPVGRADAQRDARLGGQIDAADGRGSRRDAIAELVRAFVAQEL